MRHFLLLAFAGMLGTLAPMAGAEVLRCADAAGNLSYTDGACPAGTKAMGRVAQNVARWKPMDHLDGNIKFFWKKLLFAE